MTASTKAIAQTLEEIVGKSGIVSYPALDAHQQDQVSQAVVSGTKIDCIVYPRTQAELSEVMTCACRNQWRVLPCGSRTKLSWGGLAQGIDLVVSTQRLNRLIDHAAGDLTVTAEAGMKFSDLQRTLATANQFLALDPAYSTLATLGGIMATRDAGSLRQKYGGVRDLGLGVAFVRADGQKVKAGGRVVKNVAGYDLTKLLCGSFGTLGIISEITFRLYPLPEASKTVLLTGTAESIAQVATTLTSSVLTPTAFDLLSAQVIDDRPTHTLGLVARFQGLQKSVDQQATQLLKTAQALGLRERTFVEAEEAGFWRQVQDQFWQPEPGGRIIYKVGVLPSNAVASLVEMESVSHQQGLPFKGLIHAGSGLGLVRIDSGEAAYSATLALRSLCQRASGFLTVLEAPVAFKQQLDVWGYPGNALDLMHKIKQQFDPQNLLSPYRFIGGI